MNYRFNILLLIGLLLIGCASPDLSNNQKMHHTAIATQPVSEDKAPDGESLYLNNCATCHGAHGQGNPSVMHGHMVQFDNSAYQKALSDAHIKKILHEGKGMMPSFRDQFSEAQLDALIAYIRTLAVSPSANP